MPQLERSLHATTKTPRAATKTQRSQKNKENFKKTEPSCHAATLLTTSTLSPVAPCLPALRAPSRWTAQGSSTLGSERLLSPLGPGPGSHQNSPPPCPAGSSHPDQLTTKAFPDHTN